MVGKRKRISEHRTQARSGDLGDALTLQFPAVLSQAWATPAQLLKGVNSSSSVLTDLPKPNQPPAQHTHTHQTLYVRPPLSVHKHLLCSCTVCARLGAQQRAGWTDGRQFLPVGRETVDVKTFEITPGKNLCDTEKWIRIGKVCGTRCIVLAEKVKEGLVGGETCKR